MSFPNDEKYETRQLADDLRKMRQWLTGNGQLGIFERLAKVEREMYGDGDTEEPGLIRDMRTAKESSEQNTRILLQVRWLAIGALVLAVAIAVMHSQEPSWFNDLIKWVLAVI